MSEVYNIETRKRGPFTRYAVMRGNEELAEFLHESQARAFVLASEGAQDFAPDDDFFRGYVECVYFVDTGDTDQPANDCPMSEDTRAALLEECTQFQTVNAALLAEAYARGYDAAQAGRDFHFTRNGHGVGFWDRDELREPYNGGQSLGGWLTDAARECGETFVYEAGGLLYVE